MSALEVNEILRQSAERFPFSRADGGGLQSGLPFFKQQAPTVRLRRQVFWEHTDFQEGIGLAVIADDAEIRMNEIKPLIFER